MTGFVGKWMRWSRWVLLILLVCAALGVSVLWWRGRPARHLAWAEEAVREGDRDHALDLLAVPEAASATRERALLLRARVAVEQGNLAAAVRALEQVDPKGPNAPGYAFWRGRTLYAAGEPLLAITWFAAALKLRPDDADTHRWLAAAAYDQGNRRSVISSLEEVIRLEPADARAWRTLGLVYKEDVDYERARTAFERALEIDGAQPAVRFDLAEVMLKQGDVAGAERELAACRPGAWEARRAEILAECCRLRSDVAGFRAAVDAGLAAAPGHPGLLRQRAQIDLTDGRPREALERLDQALAADPYRPETIYQRGVVLRQLGREEDARRDLARANELNRGLAEMSLLNQQAERNPHDADVRSRLGRLCVEVGKPELAASWYRAALACDPRHAAARLGLSALHPRNRIPAWRQ